MSTDIQFLGGYVQAGDKYRNGTTTALGTDTTILNYSGTPGVLRKILFQATSASNTNYLNIKVTIDGATERNIGPTSAATIGGNGAASTEEFNIDQPFNSSVIVKASTTGGAVSATAYYSVV